jgi:bla regulator protein blaR1
MSPETIAAGLTAYSLQVALLLGVGLLLPGLLRLALPRVRLAYWQGLLAAILLLPLLQPRPGITGFASEVTVGGAWLGRIGAPGPESSSASPFAWLLLLLAAGAAVRLAWLLVGFAALRGMRRGARPAELPADVAVLQEKVGARARFLVSDRVSGPVTFGWRDATVLLPPGFAALPPAAQRAVTCHELLHVRRRDWLFALFEEAVRALLWFHPGVWMLLARLTLSREQVVDGDVVRLTGARRAYLEALRAIALQPRPAAVAALPFFHHRGHLRERVAQLSKEVSMSRPRIVTLITTCAGVLALTAFVGASSFPMLSSAWAGGKATKAMKVAGDVKRPEILSQKAPVYPEAARKNKVEGVTVVDCVIDQQGRVTEPRIATTSGSQDLDQSALDAVAKWTFHPATLKGKPVAVSYTLTIRFTLDENDTKK